MILVAPDKFKGSLTAQQAAAAMADGVRDAWPQAQVLMAPLADGGEGSGEILAEALAAQPRQTTALDALARPHMARWWFEPGTQTAIVAFADVAPFVRGASVDDALRSTSYGVGQVLLAAARAGARRVLLCCGGSGCVDGGAGCLAALGFRFVNRSGRLIRTPLGGGALDQVMEVHPPSQPLNVAIDALCDVDNPLCGPRGAAPVFAPQKGATTPQAIAALTENLALWADLVERCTRVRVHDVAHGGAAGGLPAALHAFMNANLMYGFDSISRAVRLPDQLASARLCLTGEGCLDAQTIGGKVVAGVARAARTVGVPVVAFAGEFDDRSGEAVCRQLGLRAAIAINPPDVERDTAMPRAAQHLRAAVARYLRTVE